MGEPAGTDPVAQQRERVQTIQLELMSRTGEDRRGQHIKGLAVVRARFEVRPDIPRHCRVGLFARPAIYDGYVRFSNARVSNDAEPDAHGMAIKLLRVPGEKLLPEEKDASTHDFVLSDGPVFAVRNSAEYIRFLEGLSSPDPQVRAALMRWLEETHPEDVPVVQGLACKSVDSPLASAYWSQVPYAFGTAGTTACRYSVQPRVGNLRQMIPFAERGADYLTRAVRDHLTVAGHEAVFDFALQLLENPTPEQIETPTQPWMTATQPVAVLRIPPQSFDAPAQVEFGENLSFTPWHALPEHRPIGDINESRRDIYRASRALRYSKRGMVAREPVGDEMP
jgi:hypothetical protein